MTSRVRRPLELLLASLLIVADGAYLGVILKLVLTGGDISSAQLALMAIGGTVGLLAGILLLRRAMQYREASPSPASDPSAAS